MMLARNYFCNLKTAIIQEIAPRPPPGGVEIVLVKSVPFRRWNAAVADKE
jgi:hypothetical protein